MHVVLQRLANVVVGVMLHYLHHETSILGSWKRPLDPQIHGPQISRHASSGSGVNDTPTMALDLDYRPCSLEARQTRPHWRRLFILGRKTSRTLHSWSCLPWYVGTLETQNRTTPSLFGATTTPSSGPAVPCTISLYSKQEYYPQVQQSAQDSTLSWA